MCCYAAERCSMICLPPSQMHLQVRRSARFVARKTFQPGSSYHLHMKHDVTAPQEQQKPAAMSVVQAKLTISNINQTVPHAARSWCQGTIQPCPAGEGCCSSGDLELIIWQRRLPAGIRNLIVSKSNFPLDLQSRSSMIKP